MPKTTRYSVSTVEVDRLVTINDVVAAWVSHHADRHENAHRLCRFFKWFRVVKGVKVSPKESLNELVRLRGSRDVEKRHRVARKRALIDEKEQKREAILNEFWNFLKDPANRQGLRQLIKQAKRDAE